MNENDLRTLLVRATDDRPPGIDPMPALRREPRRILLPSIAVVGIAALVSVIVIGLPGDRLPEAQAQVAAAVDNTGEASYRIHTQAGARTWEGAVDPVRHVGVMTEAGGVSETRVIGDLVYWKGRGETTYQVMTRAEAVPAELPPAVALVKLSPLDPQAALEQLRSATDVREDGAASGPGWTGQRYVFSLTGRPGSGEGDAKAGAWPAASGAVEVDDQGRVRRLDVTFADNGQRDVLEFGDFGTEVTVEAPPADQVVPAQGPAGPDKPKPAKS